MGTLIRRGLLMLAPVAWGWFMKRRADQKERERFGPRPGGPGPRS